MTETLYHPLLERTQHLHDVESAGLISEVPLGKTFVLHLQMKLSASTIVAFMKAVSPETQKVFGFQMAAGRFWRWVQDYGPELEQRATPDEIQLVVSDCGKGFDVEEAKRNRGLGLVSMQERVHLMHGSLHVESKPGEGTKILAVVPLAGEIDRSSDVGDAEEPERAWGAA